MAFVDCLHLLASQTSALAKHKPMHRLCSKLTMAMIFACRDDCNMLVCWGSVVWRLVTYVKAFHRMVI